MLEPRSTCSTLRCLVLNLLMSFQVCHNLLAMPVLVALLLVLISARNPLVEASPVLGRAPSPNLTNADGQSPPHGCQPLASLVTSKDVPGNITIPRGHLESPFDERGRWLPLKHIEHWSTLRQPSSPYEISLITIRNVSFPLPVLVPERQHLQGNPIRMQLHGVTSRDLSRIIITPPHMPFPAMTREAREF